MSLAAAALCVAILCVATSCVSTAAAQDGPTDALTQDALTQHALTQDAPTVALTQEAPASDESAQSTASQIRDLSASLADMIREVDERQTGFSLTLEVGGAILTPLVDLSTRSVTVHFAARAAYHFPDLAIVLAVENARWRAPELGERTWQTALNIGVGLARYHRSGLLRTMLVIGPSILTRANDLDPAGSVGLYVDLRPLGFSWRFSKGASLVADLLYMTLVAPVLTGVPLVDFQFRSSLGIEANF